MYFTNWKIHIPICCYRIQFQSLIFWDYRRFELTRGFIRALPKVAICHTYPCVFFIVSWKL